MPKVKLGDEIRVSSFLYFDCDGGIMAKPSIRTLEGPFLVKVVKVGDVNTENDHYWCTPIYCLKNRELFYYLDNYAHKGLSAVTMTSERERRKYHQKYILFCREQDLSPTPIKPTIEPVAIGAGECNSPVTTLPSSFRIGVDTSINICGTITKSRVEGGVVVIEAFDLKSVSIVSNSKK